MGTLREFCEGVGGKSPDIVLTTRRMRPAMAAACAKNGVEHMVQVGLGRGALVLAVKKGSALSKLTSRQVYLALARDIPDREEFRRNAAIRWSDINRSLPQLDIRFLLPPREDGSRVVFDNLVLEGGCREEPAIKLIFSAEQRTTRCVTMRVDRIREVPRDQAVQALLDAPDGTVGVLSYRDFAQAVDQLVGLEVNGVAPTRDAILQGQYDYTNLYWMYAKRGQAFGGRSAAIDKSADHIIAYTLTEPVLGLDGVLARGGLIPLPPDDRAAQRDLFTFHPAASGIAPFIDWVTYAASAAKSLVNLALGRESEPAGGMDFTSLMELAGYKTQEFQTSVGILPGAGMTFGISREMSDADQDNLERKLALDAHQRPGALPAMQRSIVRSVLDVTETEGYEISRVEVELIPLPSVKLIVSPTDTQVSPDTASILRSVERLNNRLTELTQ